MQTNFRPADLLFPDRRMTITENRCMKPPIGCGEKITGFKDELSKKEYEISRLCQKCQDEFFK